MAMIGMVSGVSFINNEEEFSHFIEDCKSFKIRYMKKLGYNESINNWKEYHFIEYCKAGYFETLLFLYSMYDINIHFLNDLAFIESCKFNHIEIAKWLYLLGLNPNADNDQAFKVSCCNGHLNIVRWLLSLKVIKTTTYDEAFIRCCSFGRTKIAKLLWSSFKEYINHESGTAFAGCCLEGHLNLAKWCHSLNLKITDINDLFKRCCFRNHFKIAKWLYEHYKIDVHINNDEIFKYCCNNGNVKFIKWLLFTGGYINIYHQFDEFPICLKVIEEVFKERLQLHRQLILNGFIYGGNRSLMLKVTPDMFFKDLLNII